MEEEKFVSYLLSAVVIKHSCVHLGEERVNFILQVNLSLRETKVGAPTGQTLEAETTEEHSVLPLDCLATCRIQPGPILGMALPSMGWALQFPRKWSQASLMWAVHHLRFSLPG